VFDAYDVEAFHYLIKPIEETKFRQVMEKAVGCVEKRKQAEPLVIKVNGNYRKVPIQDIYYAENDARKIIIHLNGENVAFYEKMEVLEQKLGNSFFRSHRGYLVHLQYVDHYDSTSISLKNGENIYLAKHKYHEFVAAYMNYLTRV
jgi:DNA-binding LytR/AlgR family response regulator